MAGTENNQAREHLRAWWLSLHAHDYNCGKPDRTFLEYEETLSETSPVGKAQKLNGAKKHDKPTLRETYLA